MRLDMNIFQIAAKYAANLMGIATPEEREALENWKQESVWHTLSLIHICTNLRTKDRTNLNSIRIRCSSPDRPSPDSDSS